MTVEPNPYAAEPVEEFADEEFDNALMNLNEDEYIVSSSKPVQTSAEQIPWNGDSLDNMDSNSLLRIYYSNCFPYKQIIQWLSYGDLSKFRQREFSFTLRDGGDEEVYLRYCSYDTLFDLQKDLKLKNPEKIDIGAIYNAKPSKKNSLNPGALKPVERELVFDIDMTDYDDVRTCCSKADICILCWKFITIAVKIIHRALTVDFGFKSLLWVYSGRRGVHCWVCDERARNLSEECRKAIVNYLDIVKGGEKKSKKVNLPLILHPSIQKAREILMEYFETVVLTEQDVLSDPEKAQKFLEVLSSAQARDEIAYKWMKMTDSNEKWDFLLEYLKDLKEFDKEFKLAQFKNEILFQYLYPRLDVKVSIQLNHLLKSPFCIHPKTGRVCCPFRPENCETFNPLTVPTSLSLCKEINNSKGRASSMEPYYRIMADFLDTLKTEMLSNVSKTKNNISMKKDKSLEEFFSLFK